MGTTLIEVEEEERGNQLVEPLRVLDRPPLAVHRQQQLKVCLHLFRLEAVHRLPSAGDISPDRLLVLWREAFVAGGDIQVGALVVDPEEDLKKQEGSSSRVKDHTCSKMAFRRGDSLVSPPHFLLVGMENVS